MKAICSGGGTKNVVVVCWLLVWLSVSVCTARAQSPQQMRQVVIPRDSVQMPAWTPHPLLKGAASMALAGDRNKAGMFALRVKYPHGLHIPPHAHPNELHTTVLSGMLCVGMGTTWDTTKIVRILPGQFMRFAPGTAHFEYTVGETVLHIQGMGPMLTTFQDTTEKPYIVPR
jgi:quercetin dioxygenase-like cupin family protein